jgi:hypothetical protein
LAGRAGFEPAHGVINSHVPFQLGYRPKSRRPRFLVGAFEKCLKLEAENGQTNPEGPARLTRRLIMDLVFIVIIETEYSTISVRHIVGDYSFGGHLKTCNLRVHIP